VLGWKLYCDPGVSVVVPNDVMSRVVLNLPPCASSHLHLTHIMSFFWGKYARRLSPCIWSVPVTHFLF
jgi:hypothetical protein